MRNLIPVALACLLLAACTKNGSTPSDSSGYPGGKPPVIILPTTSITVFLNAAPMQVTLIDFSRNSNGDHLLGSIYFTAQNSRQKIDVTCDKFYEQSWASYMYSPEVIYSERADSLSPWNSWVAKNWGCVSFDAGVASLADARIKGHYYGNFSIGKDSLVIKGDFDLIFK